MRHRKTSISNNRSSIIAGLLLVIILWQVFAMALGERVMVFPGPFESFRCMLELLTRSYTYRCIALTGLRMLEGFFWSFVLAFLFGLPAGNSPFVEGLFSPFMTILRAVPTASLIYLFIVLAGFRKAPMLMVMMISFPIIYEGICAGFKNVSKSLINASRVDGAGFFKENFHIRLPLAMPYIIVALTSSFSLSFKIEIMAEVITGSTQAGLGSAIAAARANDPTNMVPIFGYSLIAVILMLMIDRLMDLIKKKTKSD